jgi:hypothetical protein
MSESSNDDGNLFSLGPRSAFGARYPSPFFDISQAYMPKNIKEIFRWCRYYFANNQVIFAAISKLAEYPVTDIVWDTADETIKKKSNEVFVETLKIKRFLIMCGLDYFTYGNAFISINYPFERFLKCAECKKEEKIERAKYKWKNLDFVLECKHCGHTGIADIKDESVKDPKRINPIRWNPENMDVEHNDITGDSSYIYNIPGRLARQIKDGKKHILHKTPEIFLRAIKKGKAVEIDPENIYHFKRPSISSAEMGVGFPLIMPCLKDLFQAQILRKAREVIAFQHIIPLWVLFPSPQGNASPFQHMNLNTWKTRVERELAIWKRDPNYIPIFPLPIGFQYIGGNARDLTVTPELQEMDRKNLAGMMVPAEFVWGGASFSGASFSLRMLENQFISYMTDVLSLLNDFLVPGISGFLGIETPKAKLARLKMMDDVQQKNLVWQANQAGKISDNSLLDDLGYDREEERRKISSESKDVNEIEKERIKSQSEAQGEAMIIQAKYQAKAQMEGQKALQDLQQEMGMMGNALMEGSVPPPEGMQQGDPALAQEQAQPVEGQLDPQSMANAWADTIVQMPQEQQGPQMEAIRAEMPTMYEMVSQAVAERQGMAVDMRPLPQQKPQRRDAPV